MKKLTLMISSEAYSDLEKIWVYTLNKWSKEQADRYYMLIMDDIDFLRTNPHAGKSAEHIRMGYRASLVKSHVIFYQVLEEKELAVIRILHQSAHLEKWLT
jgi:toxin ParE1/3/4